MNIVFAVITLFITIKDSFEYSNLLIIRIANILRVIQVVIGQSTLIDYSQNKVKIHLYKRIQIKKIFNYFLFYECRIILKIKCISD